MVLFIEGRVCLLQLVVQTRGGRTMEDSIKLRVLAGQSAAIGNEKRERCAAPNTYASPFCLDANPDKEKWRNH